ncbi:uncharacterized protein LOC105689421 [Athalia rosae]|uniref:uncharacterized protein LOC105689421 n=1 Tax=Athalia rosae TaxID=37344 RepID=UPI00062655C0|nr:uncharacterized protein LOC105689421 [Athalia rosae]
MAGELGANNEGKKDNEMREREKTEESKQSASAWGEPHSRVGGTVECDRDHPAQTDPPATGHRNSNSANGHINTIAMANCRYAAVTNTRDSTSFIQICQIRLQHLFPHLSPPPSRYNVCEDSIESTAERLGNDVIRYLLKEDLYRVSKDAVSRSMRHNVHQMLNKHSILFTSMVNRLNVVPDTAYEAFMAVADELFCHGGFTWARIVCLYAFMGRLALWARDRRMYALKKKLPSYVSRYVSEEIAHFIKGYGGWEQLCIEYPVAEEVSGAIWRSLLMTGATLGLIATILTVAS